MTEPNDWEPGLQSLSSSADSVTGGFLAARPMPGPDLRRSLYVPYRLAPPRPDLTGLIVIPLIAKEQTEGTLGLEIVSPGNRILWQDAIPLSQVVSHRPVRFDFPAIPDSHQGVHELRVFARGARVPVRVLEYRMLAAVFGVRRWRVTPLCGMVFARPAERPTEPPADGSGIWRAQLSPGLAALVGSPSFEDHYWISGWQTANVQIVTDLKIGESLLDIGCGSGRLAYGLYRWLGGRYVGVDISASAIDYCQKQFPRFAFHHMNVRSDQYNANGAFDTSGMTIPVDDGSFDVVVLMSVYTHLLPDRAVRMTAEIGRVLKPGGRCLATFFILDNARDHSQFSFRHEITPFCRVERAEAIEYAVGYARSFVEDMFARHGLRLEHERDALGQDQILFTKLAGA